MKRLLIVLFFPLFTFAQEYQSTWKGFNEINISINNACRIGDNFFVPGFEFGIKKIIPRRARRAEIACGIEIFYLQMLEKRIHSNFFQGYKNYNFIRSTNIGVSALYAWRFKKTNAKKFYKEMGFFIDLSPIRYLKGEEYYYSNPEGFPVKGFVQPRYFSFGINTGIAWTFQSKKFEFDIKPDIKFNVLPYIFNHYKNRFDNAISARINLNFRKLKN